MDYKEALEYLESGSTKPKAALEDFAAFMGEFDHPENNLKYIHIAGTNGKGSTAAMTASVLVAAGYKTGLYTSPHLVKYNERIRTCGKDIDDDAFAAGMSRICCAEEKQPYSLSVFQRITALAFLYFAEQACDIVVLEVGMGGAWDATNIIPHAEVSLILPISIEHTQQLGRTVAEIASVKAGIIREGIPVVAAAQSEEALTVIRAKAESLHAPLVVTDPSQGRIEDFHYFGQTLSYKNWHALELGLAGSYQYLNVQLVLETAALLGVRGFRISEEALRKGLKEVYWPARFEFVRNNPPFFIDGAHNPHGVEALEKNLQDYFGEKKLLFICSIMSDKDRQSMIRCLKPHIKKLFVVRSHSPRSLDADFLAEEFRTKEGIDCESAPSIEEGLQKLLQEQGPDDIAGSFGCLYLAGELREMLLKNK